MDFRKIKCQSIEIRYTPELAEIMGIILGDGGLYAHKGNKYQMIIAFNKKEVDYLNHVKSLLEGYFRPYCFGIVNDKCELKLQNISVYIGKFLLESGMKLGDKLKSKVTIPNWIFDRNLLIPAVRGLFDTDGCVYRKYDHYAQIQFKLASYPLLKSVRDALISLNFNPTKIHEDRGKNFKSWKIYLSRQGEILRFFNLISPNNPKHIKRHNKIKRNGDAGIRISEA